MAKSNEECEPIIPGKITPKKLPKQGGGGGHEFVASLPEKGEEGIEYVLMDDISDCSTYKGTYVWNEGCSTFVETSGSGGGGTIERYTFEKTDTGWVAKRNDTVIFTYVDKDTDTTYEFEDTEKGWKVTDSEGNEFEHTDKGGSGGGGELSDDLVVSNPLGRYKMGDTIPAGTTYEEIFKKLLTNVYYPTLTNPSITFTYTMPTYAEVGTSISSRAATLALDRGSINPQYTADSPYRSGAATSYTLASTGADAEYSDMSTTSGSFTVNALTRSTKGTITLTATISYGTGAQPKDSDGADYKSPLPAGSVTASKTVTFILPFYYGKTAGTSISSLSGLTKDVSAKGQKTYSYTTTNENMVIAYDSSYGNLSAIIDSNGFDVTDGWTKSTLTSGGYTYNVYIADLATTDTNAAFTFKF